MSLIHINLHFYAYMTFLLNWIVYLCLLVHSLLSILTHDDGVKLLQWCTWGLHLSGKWRHITGWLVPNISSNMLLTSSRVRWRWDHYVVMTWNIRHPGTWRHIPGEWRPQMWRSHGNRLWQLASRVMARYSGIWNKKRAAAPKCFLWWDMLLRCVIVLSPCLLCLWCKLAVSSVRQVWESVGTVQ